MPQAESFHQVIGRLHSGDEDAAAEIFRRFAAQLIRLARGRLDARLRGKVDPEDVLQSVFRSFFVREAEGQFELGDWESLWSLLVRITLRKCGRQIAAFCAGRRDVRRELCPTASEDDSGQRWEAVAHEPTPQEVVSLTETVEHLMRGLDETQRQMVVLRLQGHTAVEISRQVGRTERTVRRVLAQVREGLRRLGEQAAS